MATIEANRDGGLAARVIAAAGNLEHNKQVCVMLIARFNAMLKSLAGKAPFEHVRHLDLRSTPRSDKNYKKDWANELHSSEDGFAKVVQKFVAAIA